MKRKFMITAFLIAISFVSVTNGFAQVAKKKVTTQVKKTIVKEAATAAEITQGQAMLAKSDCLACHKLDMKIVGPAYKDVAKKYPANEANYELLAKKVIAGGSGVWGPVPMSPHATLALDDAKKMVKYILSLK